MTTLNTANIVFAGNIHNVKVGQLLTQYGDDGDVSIIKVTELDSISISFEVVEGRYAGTSDNYDLSCFEETAEEEAKAWPRLYFRDDYVEGEVALLNVKRNTIVLIGTMEEVTDKVLAIRQGTGAKSVAELRVVQTSAFKTVKLGLVL